MNREILRGEIYTTDLGLGIGSEHSGVKYCVVIQNNIGNKHSTTTVVMPITKEDKGMPTHYMIENTLPQTSYVVTEQIRVVDKERLKNKVAEISNNDMKGICRKLKLELGI